MDNILRHNLIVEVRYSPTGSAHLRALASNRQDELIEFILNHEIHGPRGYTSDFFVENMQEVLKAGISKKVSGETYGLSVMIDPEVTTIVKRSQDAEDKIIKCDTTTLFETVCWWGELMQEFDWHVKFRQPWHDIPTFVAEAPKSSIYWNPKTNEVTSEQAK